MKNTLITTLAALTMLVGCNKNGMNLPQGGAFTATITEQPELCKAKVTFENDGAEGFIINWDLNDYASINGVTYKTTTGGGVTSGFVPQLSGNEAVANPGTPKWEVYFPSDIKTTKNNNTTDDPNDVWPLYLGTSQIYEANSVNKMPMRAVSDDENLAFRCITGIIQVNLKCTGGSMVIKSIKLQTKDKPLGGPFVMEGDKAVCTNTSNTPITLKDANGITIYADGYTAFNLYAPENEYTSLTITLYDDKDATKVITLKAGKSIIVERSKITPINLTIDPADFGGSDQENPETPSDLKIIRYTTSDNQTVTPALPNGYSIINNEIVNGIGVMTLNLNVQTIAQRAFENKTTLTSIELPSCTSTLGNYAFSGCTSLVSVKLSSSLTSIGANAFYGCSSLESIEIPESLTGINNNAFQNCSSLVSVTFPTEVNFKTLPQNTFNGCTSLVNVTIPEGVTTLGTKAFANCAITEITLPSTLTYVTKQTFDGCRQLKVVTAKRYIADAEPEITEIQSDTQYLTFRNTGLEHIYVPAEAVELYKAHAGWQGKDGAWAELIEAIPAQ